MPDIKITVGDDPEHEDLTAEIVVDGILFAEISQEKGYTNLEVKIFPRSDGHAWQMSMILMEEAFVRAKKRLWELRRVPDQNHGDVA